MNPIQSIPHRGAMLRGFLALLILLLAACAGGFPGTGGGGTDDGTLYFDKLEGTVEGVDTRNQALAVSTDRDSPVAPGQRVNLYYDSDTVVTYQNQRYEPQALERGDRIVAEVQDTGRGLAVESIVVTEDSTPNVGGDPDPIYRDIAGTIRRIDTRSNTLVVDPFGGQGDTVVSFDSRTRVYLDDRSIDLDGLRVGDEVEIELATGTREALADTITVTDNRVAREPSRDYHTVRGQVAAVDERRRELVLTTRDPLISGFNVSDRNTVTFRYDEDVIVEYRGDFYGPTNLERGDGVEVEYARMGDSLWAEKILVTSSVRN